MSSEVGRAIRTDFREATELVCAAFEKPGRLRSHASGSGNHFRCAQFGWTCNKGAPWDEEGGRRREKTGVGVELQDDVPRVGWR